ncbi:MAG TPA: hypothetical protein VM219_08110 [Phycisphaerae bacterium]|nr:hypothetical protein [Phycisphaerae bacterium]
MVEATEWVRQMAVAHWLQWLLTAAGYIVACLIGHFAASRAVNALWRIAIKYLKDRGTSDLKEPIRPPPAVSFWHGFAERAIYTTAAIARPEGIAVWLAFKAIMRFKAKEEDPRHIAGSGIYMIGTAINLGFGLLGAFIARGGKLTL